MVGVLHDGAATEERVRSFVQQLRPDRLYIQLPESQLRWSLDGEDEPAPSRITKVAECTWRIAERLAHLADGSRQQVGLASYSGAMLAAAKEGEQIGTTVIAVDRPRRVTLQRIWNASPSHFRLALALQYARTCRTVAPEPIGDLLDTGLSPREIVALVRDQHPHLVGPLLDEPAQFIATAISECDGRRVMVLVSIGLMDTIRAVRPKPELQAALSMIDQPAHEVMWAPLGVASVGVAAALVFAELWTWSGALLTLGLPIVAAASMMGLVLRLRFSDTVAAVRLAPATHVSFPSAVARAQRFARRRTRPPTPPRNTDDPIVRPLIISWVAQLAARVSAICTLALATFAWLR